MNSRSSWSWAAAALACVLGLGACARAGSDDRVAGWHGDIERLVAEARAVHAGPTRPAHSAEFARIAAELAERIPDLPDRRVAVEIQRLMAMLGDGHSLLYPAPVERVPFTTLPIDVYLFEDGLFVVGGTGGGAGLVGSRVVRIGKRDTEDVLRDMAPYVSRDNDMALRSFAGVYLVMPAFLEAWGATGDVDRVTLTIVDREQRTREVTLEAGPARRTPRRLYAPRESTAPAPLYMQHGDLAHWMQPLPEHAALYIQFNQVADGRDQTLAAFAAQVDDALARHDVDNLIVDVRHNNGGNNMLLAPLLEAIARFAERDTGHRVYVLAGRSTFSAAQNFITRLEQRVPGVVFAGEPSMSSPNFTGEDNPVTLPFSGLTVSISNRYWQDSAADDTRPWIEPHLASRLTSRQWLANADPILDRVLATIHSASDSSTPSAAPRKCTRTNFDQL